VPEPWPGVGVGVELAVGPGFWGTGVKWLTLLLGAGATGGNGFVAKATFGAGFFGPAVGAAVGEGVGVGEMLVELVAGASKDKALTLCPTSDR
jgi:hypothetical protein